MKSIDGRDAVYTVFDSDGPLYISCAWDDINMT